MSFAMQFFEKKASEMAVWTIFQFKTEVERVQCACAYSSKETECRKAKPGAGLRRVAAFQ